VRVQDNSEKTAHCNPEIENLD